MPQTASSCNSFFGRFSTPGSYQFAPCDPYVADVFAAGGIDQVRNRIEAWQHVGRAELDRSQGRPTCRATSNRSHGRGGGHGRHERRPGERLLWGSALASRLAALARSAAWRISWNRSRRLLRRTVRSEAELTPPAWMRAIGAMPLANLRLEVGQWATDAASHQQLDLLRREVDRMDRDQIGADQAGAAQPLERAHPCCVRLCSISSRVSCTCMCTGRSSSSARVIRREKVLSPTV